MKINADVSQTSIPPSQQTQGVTPMSRDATVETPTSAGDAYTPSPELMRLIDLARQEPDVRESRILEVMQRLQNGAYSSADTAAKTADAILHSVD